MTLTGKPTLKHPSKHWLSVAFLASISLWIFGVSFVLTVCHSFWTRTVPSAVGRLSGLAQQALGFWLQLLEHVREARKQPATTDKWWSPVCKLAWTVLGMVLEFHHSLYVQPWLVLRSWLHKHALGRWESVSQNQVRMLDLLCSFFAMVVVVGTVVVRFGLVAVLHMWNMLSSSSARGAPSFATATGPNPEEEMPIGAESAEDVFYESVVGGDSSDVHRDQHRVVSPTFEERMHEFSQPLQGKHRRDSNSSTSASAYAATAAHPFEKKLRRDSPSNSTASSTHVLGRSDSGNSGRRRHAMKQQQQRQQPPLLFALPPDVSLQF